MIFNVKMMSQKLLFIITYFITKLKPADSDSIYKEIIVNYISTYLCALKNSYSIHLKCDVKCKHPIADYWWLEVGMV